MGIDKKIQKIVDTFGMKGYAIAKAMGVSEDIVRQKRSPKRKEHRFNEKNYLDLVEYIKIETKKL